MGLLRLGALRVGQRRELGRVRGRERDVPEERVPGRGVPRGKGRVREAPRAVLVEPAQKPAQDAVRDDVEAARRGPRRRTRGAQRAGLEHVGGHLEHAEAVPAAALLEERGGEVVRMALRERERVRAHAVRPDPPRGALRLEGLKGPREAPAELGAVAPAALLAAPGLGRRGQHAHQVVLRIVQQVRIEVRRAEALERGVELGAQELRVEAVHAVVRVRHRLRADRRAGLVVGQRLALDVLVARLGDQVDLVAAAQHARRHGAAERLPDQGLGRAVAVVRGRVHDASAPAQRCEQGSLVVEHGAEGADADAAAEEGSGGGHAQVLYHPCGQSGAHTHCATILLHTHLATAVAAVAAASETRSVHCAEHSPVTSTFAPKHHHSVLGSLSGEPSITYQQETFPVGASMATRPSFVRSIVVDR